MVYELFGVERRAALFVVCRDRLWYFPGRVFPVAPSTAERRIFRVSEGFALWLWVLLMLALCVFALYEAIYDRSDT